jgi:competence protein ComEA
MGERSYGSLVAWVVAGVLGTLAAVRLLDDPGGAPAAAPVRVEHGSAHSDSGGRDGVYVHVAGAVRRPGLYRVRSSDRVAAAIERAGGPRRRADLASVNLAARVEDGRQILVPLVGQVAAGSSPGAGEAPPATPSLGTVTAEQLEELDGIGPTLAERIVEYRAAHGGFRSLDELREVDGIGEKRLESLREALQP